MATLILLSVLINLSHAADTAQIKVPAILLGTAWYPEQWPEARWEADLALMQQAGVHMVRVGEFAWSRMEPEEGRYDLDWLEHAVAAAARHKIATVIGTPSAPPPPGSRRNIPKLCAPKRMAARISMATGSNSTGPIRNIARWRERSPSNWRKKFGHNPNVLGWQIDNEYAEISFDAGNEGPIPAVAQGALRHARQPQRPLDDSLLERGYTAWDQIPIQTGYGNPGLLLSWMRFVSDTWRSYQRNQFEVIRANSDARQFITTNMMGWFDGFDHYTVAQDLDLGGLGRLRRQGHLKPARNGAAHDLTRGFKRKNFWVMETQPGSVNWAGINNSLDKGEVRAMAWHDIGHGADTVSYWQWRSAFNGQEQYHGVLVGADGTPVPLFAEIAQIGKEMRKSGQLWQARRCAPKSRSCIPTTADGRSSGRSTTRITILSKKS